MIEVELKFPVPSLSKLRQDLIELGAVSVRTEIQADEYFNDPLRDFKKLDLALRLRTVGGKVWLTYKGPGMDEVAKMREEVELPLGDTQVADQMRAVFEGIGFSSVAVVRKKREVLKLTYGKSNIAVMLDEVDDVGEFVEMELVVSGKDESEIAVQELLAVAERLNLKGAIRTSYLDLLLDGRT